ncbi:hypothetical protein [Tenacibaculum aiptasiae]|uniref:hypothetical protein n=1 Tax=Tenacibaculum aiptasiae TaxID=426481 RepID=UPI00232F5E00|nr:hypothetical protein [Tenacibaculum aiptasiae]
MSSFKKKTKWTEIQLFGIELIFSDLKKYQILIESFLSKEKKELEKDFSESDLKKEAKKAGKKKDQYYQHLIDSYSEKHHEITKQFPHSFRASFLVQIISVIESQLREICNQYGNQKKQKFKVDDIKGSNDLEKCKLYLTTITDIDFKIYSREWQFIKQCKLLRNRIVHHNSTIKIKDKNLIDFVKNTKSIEFLNYEESFEQEELYYINIEFIIVNNELIDKLLVLSKEFFNKLLRK